MPILVNSRPHFAYRAAMHEAFTPSSVFRGSNDCVTLLVNVTHGPPCRHVIFVSFVPVSCAEHQGESCVSLIVQELKAKGHHRIKIYAFGEDCVMSNRGRVVITMYHALVKIVL